MGTISDCEIFRVRGVTLLPMNAAKSIEIMEKVNNASKNSEQEKHSDEGAHIC